MRTPILLAALLVACGLTPEAGRADAPAVVASVKPVHALAAAIMQGAGEPALLLAGAASPHGFSLKPSAARAVQAADVVLWVGPGLEAFLVRPLETMADDARVVTLSEAPGVELLRNRQLAFHDRPAGDAQRAHAGEEHEHEGAHAHGEGDDHAEAGQGAAYSDHEHGAYDLHVWLDPHNARAMAAAIAHVLGEQDPSNSEVYRNNLISFEKKLDQLDEQIAERLAPVRERPFVVFHDAYQYFVRHYGLHEVAAVAIDPERPAGARWLRELRTRLDALGPVCLFTEPSFAPDVVDAIAGEQTRSGVLDPLGAKLEPGPDLYFELMEGLASSLVDCLEDLRPGPPAGRSAG